jgi:hypothetical protein
VEPRANFPALRAVAWVASRFLDYLETDKAVDAKQVGLEDISRYGKEALVTIHPFYATSAEGLLVKSKTLKSET